MTDDEDDDEEPSFFHDPKRLLQTRADRHRRWSVGDLPPAAEHRRLRRRDRKLGEGRLASGSSSPSASTSSPFGSYVALFRGVIGEHRCTSSWSESYQITMAGLAATRLFSAGGAGGIVLTYWALRKAGMQRRQSAARMVAFLVLLYAVYMLAVIVFGILLRDRRPARAETRSR